MSRCLGVRPVTTSASPHTPATPAMMAVLASPFPWRNGIVRGAGKFIIQMLLWEHHMSARDLQLSSFSYKFHYVFRIILNWASTHDWCRVSGKWEFLNHRLRFLRKYKQMRKKSQIMPNLCVQYRYIIWIWWRRDFWLFCDWKVRFFCRTFWCWSSLAYRCFTWSWRWVSSTERAQSHAGVAYALCSEVWCIQPSGRTRIAQLSSEFLLRDAMHSANYGVARCLSVRPFVCHTLVFSLNG